MAGPVVLILGAGANIGAGVARAFAAAGYQVATAARKAKSEAKSQLHVQGDFADPSSIRDIFAEVRKSLGDPSVVVYNAASLSFPPDKSDALSLDPQILTRDLAINTVSAIAAAHEATLSFASLPKSAARTFIYTGNKCNGGPVPPVLSLGIGKTATAHAIHYASKTYREKGFRFYYADERRADGEAVFDAIDGDAHGTFYVQLAEAKEQQPWLATFVKGKGYVNFA